MATTEQIVNPATAQPALLAANRPAPAIRILLIGNDLPYHQLLTDKLSAQGFAVLSSSLLGALDNVGYADVILANWNLPGVSVVDLLAELRNRGIRVPVFFLAGNLSKSEKRLALEEGARGFIDKSHDIDGLIGRLKVLTRMFRRQQADKTISFGKLLLHMDISRAYWNQSDLCLSLGEYKTVELLASNAGHYVTYRAVYDRMHYEGFMAGDGEDGYRANVRSAIKRIRNKFRALELDLRSDRKLLRLRLSLEEARLNVDRELTLLGVVCLHLFLTGRQIIGVKPKRAAAAVLSIDQPQGARRRIVHCASSRMFLLVTTHCPLTGRQIRFRGSVGR